MSWQQGHHVLAGLDVELSCTSLKASRPCVGHRHTTSCSQMTTCGMSYINTNSISRLAFVPSLHISNGIRLTRNKEAQVNSVMKQRENAVTMCICVSTYGSIWVLTCTVPAQDCPELCPKKLSCISLKK